MIGAFRREGSCCREVSHFNPTRSTRLCATCLGFHVYAVFRWCACVWACALYVSVKLRRSVGMCRLLHVHVTFWNACGGRSSKFLIDAGTYAKALLWLSLRVFAGVGSVAVISHRTWQMPKNCSLRSLELRMNIPGMRSRFAKNTARPRSPAL